jgi:hypothetical protein
MSPKGIQDALLPEESDPARHFQGTETWHTTWKCRFLPLNNTTSLDIATDPGLDRLIYLQTFISEETEVAAVAAHR